MRSVTPSEHRICRGRLKPPSLKMGNAAQQVVRLETAMDPDGRPLPRRYGEPVLPYSADGVVIQFPL